MIGLEIEAAGQLFAGGRDRARGFVAGARQALDQIAAALGELLDHGVADLAERERDVLALFRQRLGDALRRLVDLRPDDVADGRQIVREVDLDVADSGTHLLGLADQDIALVGELLQQAADAHFIVAVGALERGDLVLHQRLELAGARERALDAVAHGRDFAADRLADGDDGIPRHAFGLGQPHRDLRHRLRDQAQFLRPPRHVGDAEEEDDRQQRGGAEPDHDGRRRMSRAERRVEIREIGPGQRETAHHPGARKDRGDEIGGLRRTALQRVQNMTDRPLVVVRGRQRGGLEIPRADGVRVEHVGRLEGRRGAARG